MDLTKHSVLATIFSDDRKAVLLIQRRDVPVWVLPGGGIEPKETPEQAIIREVKEETGYDVNILRKVGEYEPTTRIARFTHLFECAVQNGKPSTGAETKNIGFFQKGFFPKRTPFPYVDWSNDAFAQKKELIQKKLHKINYFRLTYYLISHPILVFRFILSRVGLSINT